MTRISTIFHSSYLYLRLLNRINVYCFKKSLKIPKKKKKKNQNPYIEEEQTTGQKKKYERTNNDLQNIHKTKDRLTRIPLKIEGGIDSGAPEG